MKNVFIIPMSTFFLLFFACSQTDTKREVGSEGIEHNLLRKTLLDSISAYKATVGLSVIELETGDTFSINNSTHFAMQSVYKFPLALALMNKAENREISLHQKVLISKNMLNKFSWSPLKRQNPGSDFYMTVDSLLMYMVAYSDNLACDMIFQLVGGTHVADDFIHGKGFTDIHIKYTEEEMGQEFNHMYQNSSTPMAMTALLKKFYERKILSDSGTNHILNFMTNDSTTHNRIIGSLPVGTKVAHKTGTGQQSDTSVAACNDVGIIYLPDGNHLALAIFVMNSQENYTDTERLIAMLSKKIFDHYNKRKSK